MTVFATDVRALASWANEHKTIELRYDPSYGYYCVYRWPDQHEYIGWTLGTWDQERLAWYSDESAIAACDHSFSRLPNPHWLVQEVS